MAAFCRTIKEGDIMVNQIKSILFLTLVSAMAAFFLGAISACTPGTAGYDWHSSEVEVHQAPEQE